MRSYNSQSGVLNVAASSKNAHFLVPPLKSPRRVKAEMLAKMSEAGDEGRFHLDQFSVGTLNEIAWGFSPTASCIVPKGVQTANMTMDNMVVIDFSAVRLCRTQERIGGVEDVPSKVPQEKGNGSDINNTFESSVISLPEALSADISTSNTKSSGTIHDPTLATNFISTSINEARTATSSDVFHGQASGPPSHASEELSLNSATVDEVFLSAGAGPKSPEITPLSIGKTIKTTNISELGHIQAGHYPSKVLKSVDLRLALANHGCLNHAELIVARRLLEEVGDVQVEKTTSSLKKVQCEAILPCQLVGIIPQNIDQTKKRSYRAVEKEFMDFLSGDAPRLFLPPMGYKSRLQVEKIASILGLIYRVFLPLDFSLFMKRNGFRVILPPKSDKERAFLRSIKTAYATIHGHKPIIHFLCKPAIHGEIIADAALHKPQSPYPVPGSTQKAGKSSSLYSVPQGERQELPRATGIKLDTVTNLQNKPVLTNHPQTHTKHSQAKRLAQYSPMPAKAYDEVVLDARDDPKLIAPSQLYSDSLRDRASSDSVLPEASGPEVDRQEHLAPFFSGPQDLVESEIQKPSVDENREGQIQVQTATSVATEVEPGLHLEAGISPKIHILGTGVLGSYIAHSLTRGANPPPITLLVHRPLVMQQWHEEGASMKVVRNKKIEYSRGFDLESCASFGLDPDIEYPGFGPNMEHTAKHPTTVIENLVVTTRGSVTIAALLAVKHRLRPYSTVCIFQDGLGIVDRINDAIFPDPSTRPFYMLGSSSHHIFTAGHMFAVNETKPGNMAITIVERLNSVQAIGSECRFVSLAEWPERAKYILRTFSRVPELNVLGLPARDFLRRQLERLAVNAVLGPTSVVYGCMNEKLLWNYAVQKSMKALIVEVSQIIMAFPELQEPHASIQKQFSPSRLEMLTISVIKTTRQNRSQMLQDVIDGKRTEVDFHVGYLINRAAELGIECPCLKMAYEIVKGKQMMVSRQLSGYIPFEQ